MGEGNVAVMPPMRGHERILPLQRRIFRPRCLFGSPDPLYLKDAVNQISQENRQRWNFDFEKEQPMPGRYKWQVVRGADNNGGSPKEGNAASVKVAKNEIQSDSTNAEKDFENAAAPGENVEIGTENPPVKDVENAPRKVQTRITDFMRKRKYSNLKERVSAMPPPKVPRRSST